MNIFQVLSFDQRVIVYSSEEDSIIITWNKSATFSIFSFDPRRECFEETDVKTYGGDKPLSFDDARTFALNWATE